MNISESLKRFRQEFGLTQKQVADKLGVYPQAYAAFERSKTGEHIIPRADTLIKIAQAFNVSLDYLAGLTDDPRPVNQILQQSDSAPVEVPEELTLESLQAEIKKLQFQFDRQQEEINELRTKFVEL